jgi:hypothetical protein
MPVPGIGFFAGFRFMVSETKHTSLHLFDRDTALVSDGLGGFISRITPNWSINGIPNGGYVMGILTIGALQNGDNFSAAILTANYIHRCVPGEARLTTETIHCSKQFERRQVHLYQDGTEKVRMIATLAKPTPEASVTRLETGPPDIALPEQCNPIPAIPGYTLYENLDVRLDPLFSGWMGGRIGDISELRGWIRFRQPRRPDFPSVAMFGDSFPPPVFASQGPVAWVPTIEYSVHIQQPHASELLKCRFRTRFIREGLLESEGELWDRDNRLVATSRQIAQYRKKTA